MGEHKFPRAPRLHQLGNVPIIGQSGKPLIEITLDPPTGKIKIRIENISDPLVAIRMIFVAGSTLADNISNSLTPLNGSQPPTGIEDPPPNA